MRFVCSTFGSSGDVFPMMGLALELRGRGHDVTFATNEHYAPLAQKYDLAFESLGAQADFDATISSPDLWHPRRAFGHVFRNIRSVLRRQYELHAEKAKAGPIIGITNCLGFGAFMAQDRLSIPVITLHCQPVVVWSDVAPPVMPGLFGPGWMQGPLYRLGEKFFIDPVVNRFIGPWRRELGLPPVRRVTRWWHSRYGILCLFPEWYAPPQEDWPSPRMQTDFPLWNADSNQPLADDVEAFLGSGDPPIAFTPGSTNLTGRPFFEAAVRACSILGRRGILLTEYPEQVPARLPGSVAHFRYVPLDLLLPRSAAFVHHGGIGSTSQAMLAGVPQVLMPLAHDQFDNAARIKHFGLGDSLAAGRFTGPRLAGMLAALLTSSSVAGACRRTVERLSRRDGLRRSADAIEARIAAGETGRT